MSRPVVLLTFANDRYGPTTGYLRDLVGEQRAISAALAHAPVEVVSQSNITLDELYDLFNRYGERIVAWHHGGHAESDALFLETAEGRPQAASIGPLAVRVGQLEELCLLVLNGCSTAGQVATLRAHCTAPIIATRRAIVDAAARTFAERFYRDIAADRPIDAAFASAGSRVEATAGPTRMLRPGAPDDGAPPWRLHVDPQFPASARWRLSSIRRGRRLLTRVALVLGLATVVVAGTALGSGHGCVGDPEPLPPDAAPAALDALLPDAAPDALLPDAAPDAARDAFVFPPPVGELDGPSPLPAAAYRPAAVQVPAASAVTIGRPADAPPKFHTSHLRTVEIPAPLWVMVTPVTRAHYAAVMETLPPAQSFLGSAPRSAARDAPVTGVTVAEAKLYAARISEKEGLQPPHAWRLPTEEEWEYACRTGRSVDTGPVAPLRPDGLPSVGQVPNRWQIYDMLGVVQQWTATPVSPDADPETAERAHRGGHHGTTRRVTLRCSYRAFGPPAVRDGFTGFRLVRTAE